MGCWSRTEAGPWSGLSRGIELVSPVSAGPAQWVTVRAGMESLGLGSRLGSGLRVELGLGSKLGTESGLGIRSWLEVELGFGALAGRMPPGGGGGGFPPRCQQHFPLGGLWAGYRSPVGQEYSGR